MRSLPYTLVPTYLITVTDLVDMFCSSCSLAHKWPSPIRDSVAASIRYDTVLEEGYHPWCSGDRFRFESIFVQPIEWNRDQYPPVATSHVLSILQHLIFLNLIPSGYYSVSR